jgi:hypothetical protein
MPSPAITLGVLQMRNFNDELHRLAATDETLPASTAVQMAKHGKSIDFLRMLPKDDALVEKATRRRNDGSLHQLDGLPFSECELPVSFKQTISGDPFLILDYKGRISSRRPCTAPILRWSPAFQETDAF